MRLKGISPIIASVLLIVFSVTIAVIVGTWASSYTESKLTNLELCKDLNLIYTNFNYNSTTQEGSITLQNIGAPIDGYDLYAFSSNNQKELLKEIKQNIPKSEKTTINFQITLSNPRGIIIEAIGCSGVRLMVPIS